MIQWINQFSKVLFLFLIFSCSLFSKQPLNDQFNNQSDENSFIPQYGVATPYLINETTGTIFLNENFLFELINSAEYQNITMEILKNPETLTENEYFNQCKLSILESQLDYLIYSKVYALEEKVYLDIKIINPYTDVIVYSKVYSSEIDFNINTNVSIIVNDFLL